MTVEPDSVFKWSLSFFRVSVDGHRILVNDCDNVAFVVWHWECFKVRKIREVAGEARNVIDTVRL